MMVQMINGGNTMKSILIAAVVLLVSVNVLAKGGEDKPTEVVVQATNTIVEYRFVGVTVEERDGSFGYGGLVGVSALHKLCADEFGPGARASTISESQFRGDDGAGQAWLAPGNTPMVIAATGPATWAPHDAVTGDRVGNSFSSGSAALGSAYCNSYSSASSNNSAPVSQSGAPVVPGTCNSNRPVACSAPVDIPVQ